MCAEVWKRQEGQVQGLMALSPVGLWEFVTWNGGTGNNACPREQGMTGKAVGDLQAQHEPSWPPETPSPRISHMRDEWPRFSPLLRRPSPCESVTLSVSSSSNCGYIPSPVPRAPAVTSLRIYPRSRQQTPVLPLQVDASSLLHCLVLNAYATV